MYTCRDTSPAVISRQVNRITVVGTIPAGVILNPFRVQLLLPLKTYLLPFFEDVLRHVRHKKVKPTCTT